MDTTLHLNTAVILAVVLSFVIPGISSLLSRVHWPSFVTGAITLFIATANGFVTEWAGSPNASHYDWKTAALIALASYAVAIGARLQLWQGTNVDAFLLGALGGKKVITATPSPVTGNPVITSAPVFDPAPSGATNVVTSTPNLSVPTPSTPSAAADLPAPEVTGGEPAAPGGAAVVTSPASVGTFTAPSESDAHDTDAAG